MADDKNKLFDDGKSRYVVEEAYNNVHMRLVRSREGLEDGAEEFHPEFCHQHFGEQETLYGYVNPRIDLWFAAADLTPYLNFKYDEMIDNADKVIDLVTEFMPERGGFHTNLDTFSAYIDKSDKFQPLGTLLHSFSGEGNDRSKFLIHKIGDVHDSAWMTLRERMESFSYWFIDAATYTDTDDDKWKHYVIYEKYTKSDGNFGYCFVGYAALYWYYAYNNMFRPRVGHILILPPYQKQGLGAILLQTIYNDLLPNPAVKDITAEDPAEGFVRLRDYVNACNCSKLPCLQGNNSKKDLNNDTIDQVMQRLKLPKMQVIRAYEILRLRAVGLDSKGQDLVAFRKYVQARLDKKYQKRKKVARIIEHLKPEEVEEMKKTEALTEEQRTMTVQTEYEQLLGEYRSVVNRMATHPPSTLPPLVPPSTLPPPAPPTPAWLVTTAAKTALPNGDHNKMSNGVAQTNGLD